MLLAIEAMDPTLKAIFWLVATVLFVLAAFSWRFPDRPWSPGLVALGLAFWTFPWMWDAFAAQ